MRRRGFSFAEVLIALGVLAMVLCGALVFLQTNLVFYRRQMQGLRGAFLAQDLLPRVSELPSRGRLDDFDYAVEDSNEWLRLELRQGSVPMTHQTLRKPVSRLLQYQDFETQEWFEVDAEGCAEQKLGEQDAMPVSDGRYLSWRGVPIYEGSPYDPQVDPECRQIAFLQNGQVWVLDVRSKKAACWLGGPVRTLAWHGQNSLVVSDGSRLLRVTAPGRTETLYDGALAQATVSPDLKQIAYVARSSESNDLCLYDRASRSSRVISATPDGEIRPLWSRDGQRILYGEAPAAGGTHLKCINSDGSGLQDLHIVASANNWKWR